MLSIDQISSLLRLYLDWPGKTGASPDQEAHDFYLWLSENTDSKDELADISGGLDGIRQFIDDNGPILRSAKYLKDIRAGNSNDVREDARISINTQLYVLVYDCQADMELEGKILRGVMLDMAPTGMRIETNIEVPPGSVLTMTVIQIGSGITRYHLTGEVRWILDNGELTHLGVSIFNIEDWKQWQDFYFMMSSSL